MKILNYFLLLFLAFSIGAFAQTKKINFQDKSINTEMILNGKFIQENKHPRAIEGYYMIIKDGFRLDYFENGKYFTKSKMTIVQPNLFNYTAVESTVPGINLGIKEVNQMEILVTSTKENLLKIKERGGNSKWTKFY